MALIKSVRDEEERKRKQQAQANQTAQTAANKSAQMNSDAAKRNSAGASKAPTQSAADTIKAAKEKAKTGTVTKTPKQYANSAQYVKKSNPVRQTFNYETLGTQERVDQVASWIVDPKEKQGFLDGWTAYTNTKSYKNQQKRKEQLQGLNGLYDANGRPINVNTASYSTVVQGIRSIADATKRKEAAAKLEEMTKTWGSRFYGQTYTKDIVTSYLGNPDFTEEDYKDEVAAFENAFYAQSGYEEQNTQTYIDSVMDIRNSGYSDSVQRQLKQRLDEVWKNTMGKKLPSLNKVRADIVNEYYEKAKEKKAEEEKAAAEAEKKANVEKKIDDFFSIFDPLGNPENAWDPMNPKPIESDGKSLSEKIIEDVIGPEYIKEHEGKTEQEERNNSPFLRSGLPEGVTYTGDVASANGGVIGAQFPGIQASEEKSNAPTSEQQVEMFNAWAAAGKPQAVKTQYYNVKDDGDVLRALYAGKLGLVEPKKAEAVLEMAKYPTVKKLFEAQATEWDYQNNLSTLGTKGHDAFIRLMSEDYPDEIRYDGLLLLAQLAKEADMLEMDGKLPAPTKPGEDTDEYWPESALERYLLSDDGAMARYNEIAGSQKVLEEDRAQMLAEQNELKAQKLEEARAAFKDGNPDDEQIALMKEYLPEAPIKLANATAMSKADAGFKERYDSVYSWDGGYFAYDEGAGFEASDIYKTLVTDKQLQDDSDLRYHLSEAMCTLLEEDMSRAYYLGVNLDDYYRSIGGMDNDELCRRAAVRLQQMGTKISGYDLEVLSTPTYGEGVGAWNTFKLGFAHGGEGIFAAYADTLYISSNESTVRLTAGRMRSEFQSKYGILGRDMYLASLNNLISSGDLPEGYAKALSKAINEVSDIYDIGIDPNANLGILNAAKKARRNVSLIEDYMLDNGTEGENYWMRQVSGITRNTAQAGIAAAASAVVGPKLGFAIGYSAPAWSDNVNARWNEGYGRETGKLLGTIDTAGEYLANVATFEGIMGRAGGANSMFEKAVQKFMRSNPAGVVKTIAASKSYALKLAGANAVAAAAENIWDEAVVDTAKEGLSALFIEYGAAPLLKKIDEGMEVGALDIIGAMCDGVVGAAANSGEVANQVFTGFVDATISSSVFAIAAAAGAGVNTYNGTRTAQDLAKFAAEDDMIQYDSVQKAVDIANGFDTDIEGFISALEADRKDEAFVTKFNEIAKQNRVDQLVAMRVATDDGKDGVFDRVEEINEQITSHETNAANNQAAIDTAVQSITEVDEKMNNGPVSEEELAIISNGTEAIAKNKTGLDEHNREASQKKTQKTQILEDKMAGVRQSARQQVEAESASMVQAIVEMAPQIAENAKQSERANIEKRIDDLNTQIQQEFDKGDDADYELIDNLSAQAGTLGAYLDDMQEQESGEAEAQALKDEVEQKLAEIAENKAAHTSAETQAVMEARETTAKLESEQKDLQGVVRRLKSETVYVDDAQAATILYETGAKSISEVNKRLGTKLTRTQGKGIPLDGSFYAELRDMAPAYFREAWDAHPEEAVVFLMQRSKLLKSDIEESKQEEQRANEAYRAKASERFKDVNKKAAEIPPGHALSQFENQNIQSSDVSTEETNELLKGTTHKVDTHKELETNAARRIAENGLRKTFTELVQADELNNEDVVTARKCLELFKRNGDFRSHAILSAKLGKESTKAGKKLNVFSLFQKRSAANAAADTLEIAEAYNKKKGKYAEEATDTDAQMSLGETNAQPFMESAVSLSTSDPAMQKLSSDVKKRSGLSMYWANMPDGMRGFFDRAKGVIVLNQKIGAAQGAYITAIHEYTHFMEQSKQYDDYADAVLKAAYGAEYDGSTAMLEDEAAIRDEYEARGEELTPDLLRKELVAAATEQILLGDETFMRRLFSGGNGGVAVRILSGMDSFMRKSEAKKGGKEAMLRYELIEAARAKMQDAIANAGKWKAESSQSGPQKSIQVERNVQGAQTQLGNQQMISDESYDSVEAPMPEGPVEMKPEPNGVQQEIQDPADMNAGEVTRRVMANIDALNQNVSTDNEWGLPLNPFQLEQIKKYKLNGVKLPGLAYNKATTKQRMLCAILATPSDRIGPNKMTLTEQLDALKRGKLAVVTEADYNYILSQAAIVESVEVDEAGVPLNREGEQAYGRMRDAQANIEPVSNHEKRQTWRIIGMLTSPVSSIKNINGNLIMQEADRVSTLGAAWLDAQVAKKTGTRSVGVATMAERKAGTAAAIKRGRDTFDDAFVSKTSTSRSRNYDSGEGRVFQTEAFEFVRTLTGFAMDAPDQMFMEKTIVEEMAVLKRLDAKIRDEETGQMRSMTEGELYEEAYNRASERFYHDDNRMTKILNEVYNVPFVGTAARVLVPFAKTPSNVAIRMFDYSPLGLAKSVFYDGLYAMNHDKDANGVGANFDQRKFVMGVGRGMTGTAITAIGALLLKAGILEFGREEEENTDRRNVMGSLGRPYSMYVNIGDTKHEIAFTMPALAGLAIGAGIADRIEDDETLYNIVMGVISDQADAFFDNSYLSSLNDIFRGYGEGSDIFFNTASKVAEQYITQMLSPAALRVFAKALDPYTRDTTSSSQIRQMINELVIQNWPKFRETLPIKYDLTGDAKTQHKTYQDREGWANEAMHWFDSLLTPTATYTEKDDEALLKLLDLSYVMNTTTCLPKQLISDKDWSLSVTASFAKDLGYKENGKGIPYSIKLTDDEKRQVNQEYGYLLFNGSGTTRYKDASGRLVRVTGIRELMETKAWQEKEPDEQVKDIEAKIKEVKLLIMKKYTDEKKKNGEL